MKRMGLQSTGECPHCGRRVDLNKSEKGFFTCPICSCEYKHNFIKWLVAIPFVVLMSILEFCYTIPFGPIAVWLAIGAVLAITKFMPDYRILHNGIESSLLPATKDMPQPRKKESKRFTVFVVVIVALFLAAVAWMAIMDINGKF
jgi:hypothetical protein